MSDEQRRTYWKTLALKQSAGAVLILLCLEVAGLIYGGEEPIVIWTIFCVSLIPALGVFAILVEDRPWGMSIDEYQQLFPKD